MMFGTTRDDRERQSVEFWPDGTFVTEPWPDGTSAVAFDSCVDEDEAPFSSPPLLGAIDLEPPTTVHLFVGSVEKVLVLWDGVAPGDAEVAGLVRQVVPDHPVDQLRVQTSTTAGVSPALGRWHIYNDERDGKLSPGAWRRTREVLVASSRGGTAHGPRLVLIVDEPSGNAVNRRVTARHEWAHELILRHMARVELSERADLMKRSAWRQMMTPEVMDYIVGDAPCPVRTRALASRIRRFGELIVMVSFAGATDPARIRALMPGGYFVELDALTAAANVQLGGADIAHWILCRGLTDEDTTVHLSFLPALGITPLLALDLLSAKERRGSHKVV